MKQNKKICANKAGAWLKGYFYSPGCVKHIHPDDDAKKQGLLICPRALMRQFTGLKKPIGVITATTFLRVRVFFLANFCPTMYLRMLPLHHAFSFC
jgi:hypothetical protein